MTRFRHRAGDEQGAVLLLAIGFITFIGVIAVVLLNYATTNILATDQLRVLRARQFSGDGAVDLAINSIRSGGSAGYSSNTCVTSAYGPITLNGAQYRVSCTGTSNASTADVTFSACQSTSGTCSPSAASLVAAVHYIWTTSPATTQVTAWSVKK